MSSKLIFIIIIFSLLKTSLISRGQLEAQTKAPATADRLPFLFMKMTSFPVPFHVSSSAWLGGCIF
jgi:hypothetical protein